MKYFSLIWAQLFRSRTRTLLTLLSVVAAFLLFGMLDSVRVAFTARGSVEGANRLITASRLSITQSLPIRLESQIKQVEGVRDVTYAMWFGSTYQDPKNFFPSFSVAPNYFDIYRELEVAPAQLRDWQENRTSAIVGETLAKQFGWTIGDTIAMQSTFFRRSGSIDWPLQLTGVYRSKDYRESRKDDKNSMMNWLIMNWKHFDESNDYVKNQVNYYIVALDNPNDASRVAQAIDAISANSDHETKTQTESAFQQAFVNQFANIGMIVTSIMTAVFFTLLLLTGNSMSQTVRERVPELATLKTLGFKDTTILGLVVAESVLLMGLGGSIGMGLAAVILPALESRTEGMLPPVVPSSSWLIGITLIVVFGIVVGLLPALRAKRLNIVDALTGS